MLIFNEKSGHQTYNIEGAIQIIVILIPVKGDSVIFRLSFELICQVIGL